MAHLQNCVQIKSKHFLTCLKAQPSSKKCQFTKYCLHGRIYCLVKIVFPSLFLDLFKIVQLSGQINHLMPGKKAFYLNPGCTKNRTETVVSKKGCLNYTYKTNYGKPLKYPTPPKPSPLPKINCASKICDTIKRLV